uniref:Uncharacterized protein n=1 Tax=Oryza brachyantha TaxID=4533 RepID=J3L3F4_ORYBR
MACTVRRIVDMRLIGILAGYEGGCWVRDDFWLLVTTPQRCTVQFAFVLVTKPPHSTPYTGLNGGSHRSTWTIPAYAPYPREVGSNNGNLRRPDPVIVTTTTMGAGCHRGSNNDGGRIRMRDHREAKSRRGGNDYDDGKPPGV